MRGTRRSQTQRLVYELVLVRWVSSWKGPTELAMRRVAVAPPLFSTLIERFLVLAVDVQEQERGGAQVEKRNGKDRGVITPPIPGAFRVSMFPMGTFVGPWSSRVFSLVEETSGRGGF